MNVNASFLAPHPVAGPLIDPLFRSIIVFHDLKDWREAIAERVGGGCWINRRIGWLFGDLPEAYAAGKLKLLLPAMVRWGGRWRGESVGDGSWGARFRESSRIMTSCILRWCRAGRIRNAGSRVQRMMRRGCGGRGVVRRCKPKN